MKKYWLRGGIIGGVFGIIPPIAVSIKFLPNLWYSQESFALFVGFVLPLLLIQLIIFVMPGIIIGAFFGWLYGKIKNRNKIN